MDNGTYCTMRSMQVRSGNRYSWIKNVPFVVVEVIYIHMHILGVCMCIRDIRSRPRTFTDKLSNLYWFFTSNLLCVLHYPFPLPFLYLFQGKYIHLKMKSSLTKLSLWSWCYVTWYVWAYQKEVSEDALEVSGSFSSCSIYSEKYEVDIDFVGSKTLKRMILSAKRQRTVFFALWEKNNCSMSIWFNHERESDVR